MGQKILQRKHIRLQQQQQQQQVVHNASAIEIAALKVRDSQVMDTKIELCCA